MAVSVALALAGDRQVAVSRYRYRNLPEAKKSRLQAVLCI